MNSVEKIFFSIFSFIVILSLSVVSYFFETARHLFLHMLFVLSIPPGSIITFLYKANSLKIKE